SYLPSSPPFSTLSLHDALPIFLARVVDISFVIHILGVHLDNFATDSSGLRIPTHPITLSECFCHDQTCAACRPLLLGSHLLCACAAYELNSVPDGRFLTAVFAIKSRRKVAHHGTRKRHAG